MNKKISEDYFEKKKSGCVPIFFPLLLSLLLVLPSPFFWFSPPYSLWILSSLWYFFLLPSVFFFLGSSPSSQFSYFPTLFSANLKLPVLPFKPLFDIPKPQNLHPCRPPLRSKPHPAAVFSTASAHRPRPSAPPPTGKFFPPPGRPSSPPSDGIATVSSTPVSASDSSVLPAIARPAAYAGSSPTAAARRRQPPELRAARLSFLPADPSPPPNAGPSLRPSHLLRSVEDAPPAISPPSPPKPAGEASPRRCRLSGAVAGEIRPEDPEIRPPPFGPWEKKKEPHGSLFSTDPGAHNFQSARFSKRTDPKAIPKLHRSRSCTVFRALGLNKFI